MVKLHKLGVLHRDVNRFNFVVQDSGEAFLVDYASAIRCESRDEFQKELECLEQQLATEEMDGGMVYLDSEINQELDAIAKRDRGISNELLKQAIAGKITMTNAENKAAWRSSEPIRVSSSNTDGAFQAAAENCYAANEQLDEAGRRRLLKASSSSDTRVLLLIRCYHFSLDFDCEYGRAPVLYLRKMQERLWHSVQLQASTSKIEPTAIGILRREFVNHPICLVGTFFSCGGVRCSSIIDKYRWLKLTICLEFYLGPF